MIEVVLSLVIFGLIGLLAWEKHNNRKERSKFLNAILSKDTTDMLNLEVADKTNVEVKQPQQEDSDVVPLESLSQEEFESFIKGQNG